MYILFFTPYPSSFLFVFPLTLSPLPSVLLLSLTIFDLPTEPASFYCLASHPFPLQPLLHLHLLTLFLFPLLHWPGRSVSLSSSPPPPPASACGPTRPEASSRPPLASSAPPPTSAAEPAPPSPGSVGTEESAESRPWGINNKSETGIYVNGGQILQYKADDCQMMHLRIQIPIQGFVKPIPLVCVWKRGSFADVKWSFAAFRYLLTGLLYFSIKKLKKTKYFITLFLKVFC